MQKEKNLTDNSMSAKEEAIDIAVRRCFSMVEYINDYASDIITDIIHNNPCAEAENFLIFKPEELAIRAFKKAIDDFENIAKVKKQCIKDNIN